MYQKKTSQDKQNSGRGRRTEHLRVMPGAELRTDGGGRQGGGRKPGADMGAELLEIGRCRIGFQNVLQRHPAGENAVFLLGRLPHAGLPPGREDVDPVGTGGIVGLTHQHTQRDKIRRHGPDSGFLFQLPDGILEGRLIRLPLATREGQKCLVAEGDGEEQPVFLQHNIGGMGEVWIGEGSGICGHKKFREQKVFPQYHAACSDPRETPILTEACRAGIFISSEHRTIPDGRG